MQEKMSARKKMVGVLSYISLSAAFLALVSMLLITVVMKVLLSTPLRDLLSRANYSYYLEVGISGALAAAIVAPCFWWLVVLRHSQISQERGILAGLLSSIAVHPLTWMIFFCIHRGNDSLYTISPAVQFFLYSFWSLIACGWLTMLVGVIGYVILVEPVLQRFYGS